MLFRHYLSVHVINRLLARVHEQFKLSTHAKKKKQVGGQVVENPQQKCLGCYVLSAHFIPLYYKCLIH